MTRYLTALKVAVNYKLMELRVRNRHESTCTYGTSKPAYGSNGETYDVAIRQPCICFLSKPDPEEHIDKLKLLHHLAQQHADIHDKFCASRFPEPSTYRNKPVTLQRACNCWISLDKAQDKV